MSFLPNNYTEPTNPILNFPDFMTHSNYIECLKNLSEQIIFNCNYPKNKLSSCKLLQTKIKLINLTFENIIEEYKKIRSFQEYAIICSSWIPVKSYYLIFNLLLVLGYMLSGDERYFRKGHKKVFAEFKRQLELKNSSFDKPIFNCCVNANRILSWQIPKSENLKKINVDRRKRIKQIIKILYRYAKEDYKNKNNIKRLSGKKLIDFNNCTSIGLFDFFYWYRIKANYRDMEFIDEGVPIIDFFNFYKNYFLLTINFSYAFKKQINIIAVNRLGTKII